MVRSVLQVAGANDNNGIITNSLINSEEEFENIINDSWRAR